MECICGVIYLSLTDLTNVTEKKSYNGATSLLTLKTKSKPRFHQVSKISHLLASINNGASVKVYVENQYFELHDVSVDSATVSGLSVWEMCDEKDGR
ncbi:hypothetical protein DPMN_113715 [Dreissena polymorpha]|uniref:Uncharacterized protein n=1 Tax=Dreissena polymorpha TaxID=45954 RepID=A0A9D4QR96_DREPO|nr:hypothetical protein DPMN_113715 [Dreissena polymorpha]